MEYYEFGLIDFACDEYFIQWVLEPNVENSAFWETWLKENPEKSDTAKEAKQMITMLHFKEDKPKEQYFQSVWSSIMQALDEDPKSDEDIEKSE